MERKYDHMISKYHHRFLEERFKGMAINRSEAPYLKMIYKHNQIKMNDLIQKFFYHKSHTTRAIKRLVEDGYVVKTIDPEDKRGFILTITDKGKAIGAKLVQIISDWDKLMSSFLEKEEQEFIEKLAEKIYRKLREYYGEDDTYEETT